MRAGAHRLPQPIERFIVIPAKAKHASEHADHKGAVRIERERGAGFRNRRFPFAVPHPHVRQDGVRHRILVVERDGNARLVAWGA